MSAKKVTTKKAAAAPKAMSAKERVAASKARRMEQGLKRYPVWIPDDPEITAQVVAYCERITNKFLREKGKGQ